MFNRQLTIGLKKRDKKNTTGISDVEEFEIKTETILLRLEDLGAKMFLGMCAYILLDTYRQVKVANAIYHPTN